MVRVPRAFPLRQSGFLSRTRAWGMVATLSALLFLPGAVFGGPVEDLQPGFWYQVTNSKIQSVLPNPIPPGATGPESITIAWNGGAYDTKRDRFIVTGGGHNDYGGNELYAFDLATLTWSRAWGPSASIPPIQQPSCNEAYSDGNPASRHTYDGLEYLPNVDRLWMHGGSLYCAGGGASLGTWLFDFAALKWTRKSSIPSGAYELEETSAYDPVTGHVFVAGPASAQALYEYDPVADKWSQRGDRPIGYGQSAALDPVRRKYVSIGSGAAYVFTITPSGTLTRQNLGATGATEIEGKRYPGFEYDPVSDRLVAWSGGANVYSLNMDTKVWTKHVPDAGNTVVPTAAPSQGTFGRWRYIPSRNVFIAVNSIDGNTYIYKLAPGGGAPPPTGSIPASPANIQVR